MKRPIALCFPLIALLWALVLLACPRAAQAATTIPGGNIINQTWTPAGSPYLVQGDIIVPVGAKLTVQAGTEVQFATTDALVTGKDTTEVEMTIRGTLEVLGTAASPVNFRSTTVGAGQWYGVVVEGTTATMTMTDLVVQHAQYGFHVTDGAPTLSNFTALTNSYGVYYTGTGGGSISNAVFRGNSSRGVYSYNTGAGSVSIAVTNTTFNQNGSVGLHFFASGPTLSATITNSIITNHTTGIYKESGAGTTVAVNYSNVWGNSTGYSGTSAGTGSFSANPLYVSSTNPRLTSNSPARFASAAGTDIGALPYTGDATSGLLGTLWTNTTLSLAGSPYTASGDLTIAPGVTLTLDAGVTVRFATTDAMVAGTDTTETELIVRGTLTSKGTAAQPVTLASTTAGAGQWYGVIFRQTASNCVVNGVTVTDAQYGFHVAEGAPALESFTAVGNSYGVYYTGTGGGSITNAVFRGNSSRGVYSYNTGAGSVSIAITNSTFNQNGSVGLHFFASGPTLATSIKNSIITNHTTGIYKESGAGTTVTVTYSDVWGNSTNYSGTSGGAGTISSNPLYVASTNLKLQPSSFCIDVGTAVGAPAKDIEGTIRPLNGDGLNGAEFDMGAYEYAPMSVCGDGALGAGEMCDDGAANGQYGKCKADCTGPGPYCGDGATNGPEQCDDGNMVNNDVCTNLCKSPVCT
jgi:cysteine-rich repeat protein